MPQQRPNKAQTPINSDAFNLTPDLATLADTLGVIVPVANRTEADSVATARATAGWPVTDARPLYVHNAATGRLEIKVTAGWKDWNTPLGPLYKNKVTASSGAVSDAIIQNIATFTFTAGRAYRIVWDPSVSASDTTSSFNLGVHSASTADAAALLTGLTVLEQRTVSVNNANTTQHVGPITAYYDPASTVTIQIKFRIQRVAGAGTMLVSSGTDQPSQYRIYDDGAAV